MTEPGHFHFLFEAGDYDASVAFYRDVLCLPVVGQWDRGADRGTMFGAEAGIIEVLADCGGRRGPKRLGVAVQVPDVDALFQSIVSRSGAVLLPPTDRPWGTREMVLVDPEDNAVVFFSLIQ